MSVFFSFSVLVFGGILIHVAPFVHRHVILMHVIMMIVRVVTAARENSHSKGAEEQADSNHISLCFHKIVPLSGFKCSSFPVSEAKGNHAEYMMPDLKGFRIPDSQAESTGSGRKSVNCLFKPAYSVPIRLPSRPGHTECGGPCQRIRALAMGESQGADHMREPVLQTLERARVRRQRDG